MAEVPMKLYWAGEDIEDLPREDLIKIIHQLHQQVETTRAALLSTINVNRAALAARQRS